MLRYMQESRAAPTTGSHSRRRRPAEPNGHRYEDTPDVGRGRDTAPPTTAPGYDRPGYDRPGYDRPGDDRPDYDRPGTTARPRQPRLRQARLRSDRRVAPAPRDPIRPARTPARHRARHRAGPARRPAAELGASPPSRAVGRHAGHSARHDRRKATHQPDGDPRRAVNAEPGRQPGSTGGRGGSGGMRAVRPDATGSQPRITAGGQSRSTTGGRAADQCRAGEPNRRPAAVAVAVAACGRHAPTPGSTRASRPARPNRARGRSDERLRSAEQRQLPRSHGAAVPIHLETPVGRPACR